MDDNRNTNSLGSYYEKYSISTQCVDFVIGLHCCGRRHAKIVIRELSGLLNLKHPKAVSAGLKNKDEPVQLFLYTVTHPKYGVYLIDSGVSESFIDASNNSDVSFIVKKAMDIPSLKVLQTTKQIIEKHDSISGVLLTHLHLDHIMGFSDIASDIPVYVGPNGTKAKALIHIATRGTTNRLLKSVSVLNEWAFDESQVLDIFGDGSLWAIHVPGHSPGSTAYLDQSVVSLAMLKKLVSDHPSIEVHPGHQN